MKTPTDQTKKNLDMRKHYEKELRTIKRIVLAGEAAMATAEKKSIKVRRKISDQACKDIFAEMRACERYVKGIRKDTDALTRRAAILEGRLS